MENTCIYCGEIIPEGRMVCPNCIARNCGGGQHLPQQYEIDKKQEEPTPTKWKKENPVISQKGGTKLETVNLHALKCYSEYFQAQAAGLKTFEVRKADRNFAVGDWLFLEEVKDAPDGTMQKTGDYLYLVITYILPGGDFGIAPDYCVLGTKRLAVEDDDKIFIHAGRMNNKNITVEELLKCRNIKK